MDNRILTILKAVAYGEVCYDDTRCGCLYCDGEEFLARESHDEIVDHIRHKPDCPILLARAVLKEIGTPLRLYQIEYEYIRGNPKHLTGNENKMNTSQHVTAYDEEDVKRQFPEGRKMNRYNMKITSVRDV